MYEYRIGTVYVIHDYCYFDKAQAKLYEDGKDIVKERVIMYLQCDVERNSINAEDVTFFNTLREAQEELEYMNKEGWEVL